MIPRTFDYVQAKSLDEAISLLKKYGADAKILAGGQSLIPLMKLRLASPPYLIDINSLPGLSYIRESGRFVLIGALTRHHDVERSDVVLKRCRILADTASVIGDPQVRNLGTMAGSLAHCDPSGDWGATILALRGEMKALGPSAERWLMSDEFFVDTFQPALKPEEILIEIRIPLQDRSAGAYLKLERRAGDFATVGVAAQLAVDTKGVCRYAGVGLTAVGPTSLRAKKAEDALMGKEVNDDVIEKAAQAASEGLNPPSDIRGSSEYRTAMVKVFTRRALKLALTRALEA